MRSPDERRGARHGGASRLAVGLGRRPLRDLREDRRASLLRAGGADQQRHAHGDREHRGGAEDDQRGGEIDTEHARPRFARSAAAATIAVALWSWVSLADAAEPLRYEVSASVARGRGEVTMDVALDVALDGTETELRLWLFPDRLAVSPAAMEERSWRWIYPGEVDLGGITVSDVEIDQAAVETRLEPYPERDAGGSDLVLPMSPGAPRTVHVTMHVVLDVPDRFGRLGKDGGVVSLAAPWYPLLLSPDAERGDAGWAFDVPHHVTIDVDDGEAAIGAERGHTLDVERVGPYVPVLVAEHIHHRRVTIDGTEVVFVSDEAEPTVPSDDEAGIAGLRDLIEVDRIGIATPIVAQALATARWLEAPIPSRVVITTVPSRTELTGIAPGTALISDRLFEIFPVEEVREFHQRALRRAVLGLVADEISRRVERPVDRGWATDLRAVVLLDLDTLRRSEHADRPEDLLSLFAFHPAVDQLLYAPQTTFDSTYFGAIDERDRFHDDPVRARVPYTNGRRILECARDVLGEATGRFVARLVRGRRSVEDALLRIDAEAAARLPGWLEYGTREVNYRLGAIVSEHTEAGWRHTIEIFRDGDERPEPVEVEVVDSAGHHVTARWEATGARGEVVIDTPEERSSVTIDPRQRIPESARVADGHPRVDDTTSLTWRLPIISAFSLDVLGSENNVTGLIDFALRQRYDLEHTIGVRLSRTTARTGGRLRYIQGLGPKVHNNRRLGFFGGGAGLNYVTPGFGGSLVGGWAIELELLGGIDSRSFIYDPREAYTLTAAVIASGTIREDGEFILGARGGVRGTALVPAGLLNSFFFCAGGGFTVGPALDADRQSIGGRNGLRGFATDELLGNGAVYAIIEHRWTMVTDLAVNILHLVWAREIQLAWWVGGGAVFDTPARMRTDGTIRPGETAHGAFEAGAGLRFHYEYGGIQPGVLALDFGVPISRLIETPQSTRTPIGFYVGFDQYF